MPSVRVFGRRTRTLLPGPSSFLAPNADVSDVLN